MFAYASRTGTRRNLAALRQAGWGLMLSPRGVLRTEGFERYCLDNGAWTAYVNKEPFDTAAFIAAYGQFGPKADFVVLPDIVAGGKKSLKYSLSWKDCLKPLCPWLLAVQDGMDPADVAPLVGPNLGIFVGGTTEFKEGTLKTWGEISRARMAYLHVGRVNTIRRIFLCRAAGVHSIDGSNASRYQINLSKLENARQQLDFGL